MKDIEKYVNDELNKIKAEKIAPSEAAKAQTIENNKTAKTIIPIIKDTMKAFARRFDLAFVNASRESHGKSHLACYELWRKSFWGFASKDKPKIIAVYIGGSARQTDGYVSGGSAYQTTTKNWTAGSILIIHAGDFKYYDNEVLQGKVNREWLLDKLAKQYVSWQTKYEIK